MEQIDFPDVTITNNDDLLVLRSAVPLSVLSSAVVSGGMTQAAVLVNAFVDKHDNLADPMRDLRRRVQEYGINEPFVGLMTAVYLHEVQVVTVCAGGITVSAVLTAGVSNATSAGLSPPARALPGTINVILLLDANLSPAAMVNGVITATEAKCDVLRRLGVQTPAGLPATGTSTDAVVLAATRRGVACSYAGPATTVGWLIGKAVRQALEAALA